MINRRGRPGLLGTAARTAVVAGTATAVSGNVARRQQQQAVQAQQAQAAQQAAEEQRLQEAVAAQLAAQQAAAPPPPPPAAAPAPAGGDDTMDKLQQLATMKSQGLLTDDEFAAAKAKLLGL
jgi:hypothetical protein